MEAARGMDDVKNLHDEVFIQSIDRKERISKFLIKVLEIPEIYARDDNVISEVLEQLLRENNPILEPIEKDISIYYYEWIKSVEEDMQVFRNLGKNGYYDRAKAKEYIDTYWKNYNPAYPSFDFAGGDCANFVSQILYAGGMPWADIGSKDHYTWVTNWYCKPGASNKDGDPRITLSWKVAAAFKSYWIQKAEKAMLFNYSEVPALIEEIIREVYIGDVVQFCYANGIPWHTLAITDFIFNTESNSNDIVLASHTIDSNSRSLIKTLAKYPGDYKLRFYVIKQGE